MVFRWVDGTYSVITLSRLFLSLQQMQIGDLAQRNCMLNLLAAHSLPGGRVGVFSRQISELSLGWA